MGGGSSRTLSLSEEQRLAKIETEFEGIWVETGSRVDHGHRLNIFTKIVIFPELVYHIAIAFYWGRNWFIVGKGIYEVILLFGLVVDKSWVFLAVSHRDWG